MQRNTFEFYFYFIAVNLSLMWKPRCALLRVLSVVITAPTSFPVAEWLSKYNHKGRASFPWSFILKGASWGSSGQNEAMESGFQGTHTYLLHWKHISFLIVMLIPLPCLSNMDLCSRCQLLVAAFGCQGTKDKDSRSTIWFDNHTNNNNWHQEFSANNITAVPHWDAF